MVLVGFCWFSLVLIGSLAGSRWFSLDHWLVGSRWFSTSQGNSSRSPQVSCACHTSKSLDCPFHIHRKLFFFIFILLNLSHFCLNIHLRPPLTAVHLDEENAEEGRKCEEDNPDHDGESCSLLQDEVLLVAHFCQVCWPIAVRSAGLLISGLLAHF